MRAQRDFEIISSDVDDLLIGAEGNDTITGGVGSDALHGGFDLTLERIISIHMLM